MLPKVTPNLSCRDELYAYKLPLPVDVQLMHSTLSHVNVLSLVLLCMAANLSPHLFTTKCVALMMMGNDLHFQPNSLLYRYQLTILSSLGTLD